MNVSELLEELGSLVSPADASPEDGWYTAQEMCDITGMSRGTVIRKIHVLNDAGRLEHKRVKRPRPLDGQMGFTNVYRITPTPEATP